MPKVSNQLKATVHIALFLVLRSFGAVVCSDAGSLASNELVTIRNKVAVGFLQLQLRESEARRTKAPQHRIPDEWISAECGIT